MKKTLGQEIIEGLEDAIAYYRGDKTRGRESFVSATVIDVKAIRNKSGLTQEEFSRAFGIKPRTLQDWELYKRMPHNQSKTLLALIDQNPKVVTKTLQALGIIGPAVLDKRKKPQRKYLL